LFAYHAELELHRDCRCHVGATDAHVRPLISNAESAADVPHNGFAMNRRGRRLGCAASLLASCLFVACDPGGTYRVPGGTVVTDNGARAFELDGDSQMPLRASASWFTSKLHTFLSITNKGSTSLIIRPDRFHLTDRSEPLAYVAVPRCAGHDREGSVTLAHGDTCQLFVDFNVQPDRDRLRTLTLTHDGVTREGAVVPVSVTFELE
jgi:hypothetical protein